MRRTQFLYALFGFNFKLPRADKTPVALVQVHFVVFQNLAQIVVDAPNIARTPRDQLSPVQIGNRAFCPGLV